MENVTNVNVDVSKRLLAYPSTIRTISYLHTPPSTTYINILLPLLYILFLTYILIPLLCI